MSSASADTERDRAEISDDVTVPKRCPQCGGRYPADFRVCPRDAIPLEDAPADDDHVVDGPGGFRVLIDPASAPIVAGSTLEFNDSMLGGGLKMVNPQVKHECACGESFSL